MILFKAQRVIVRLALLAVGLSLLLPAGIPAAAAELDVADTLSVERCVEIALANHPSLTQARYSVESQAASVGVAAAGSRPQVSLSPGYSFSRNEGVGQAGSYNTDISLRQELYDSGRRGLQVSGAKTELAARIMDERDTVDSVVTAVQNAYYSLNRATREFTIARDRVANYERRAEWAKEFYRVGTKPKIEVTKAETDLAGARLDLVSAQGALDKAIAALAYAMGIPVQSPEHVIDELAFARYDAEPGEVLNAAMANRADIKAQDLRVEGARASLELAQKGLAPTVTGTAGYGFAGETDPLDDRSWRVGVGIDIPLFDGGSVREGIRKSAAELEIASARRESLRQDVVLEVRNAMAALAEAEEAVQAAYEVEKQARETLDLALGRYKAGVGEALEISDAVETYARASQSVVTALYNHKASILDLKRTMGVVSDEFRKKG